MKFLWRFAVKQKRTQGEGGHACPGLWGWLLTPDRVWRQERVGFPDVARSS